HSVESRWYADEALDLEGRAHTRLPGGGTPRLQSGAGDGTEGPLTGDTYWVWIPGLLDRAIGIRLAVCRCCPCSATECLRVPGPKAARSREGNGRRHGGIASRLGGLCARGAKSKRCSCDCAGESVVSGIVPAPVVCENLGLLTRYFVSHGTWYWQLQSVTYLTANRAGISSVPSLWPDS